MLDQVDEYKNSLIRNLEHRINRSRVTKTVAESLEILNKETKIEAIEHQLKVVHEEANNLRKEIFNNKLIEFESIKIPNMNLVGSIYFNLVINETVQETVTEVYKQIEFYRSSLFLQNKEMHDDREKTSLNVSRLTPLYSGDFLQTEGFSNFDARLSIISSDFRKTSLSRYFIDFPLYQIDRRMEIRASSNGKFVVACETDFSTRAYILNEKLDLIERKDIPFRFSKLLVNKNFIFLMENNSH